MGGDPQCEVLAQQAGEQGRRGLLVLPAVVDVLGLDPSMGDLALPALSAERLREAELLTRRFEAVDLAGEGPGQRQRVDELGPAWVLRRLPPGDECLPSTDLLDLDPRIG